ncbi:MAG: purine-nucleoside phosphorylase [Gemmatimonadaceae bacterium]|nr:purine-nucleoside phosphorylase [Gemmatimonadaceae bacterium]
MSVAAAVERIRERGPVRRPVAAIVLGSGLGGLAARIDDARRVMYADIPGFAPSGVAGHEGALIHGMLGGRDVLAFAGRFHVYEGHTPAQSAFPIRVAHALGAGVLLLSNAAGGVRRSLRPGQLMLVRDQLNLTFDSPLIGALVSGDHRFPDMSTPFDPTLCALLHDVATEQGISLEDGVYGGLTGPAYETPAEVRMLERFGIDAVGMSTVSEVLVARAMGLRVAAVSCITNPAAGLAPVKVDHADVIAVTRAAARAFEELVIAAVQRL